MTCVVGMTMCAYTTPNIYNPPLACWLLDCLASPFYIVQVVDVDDFTRHYLAQATDNPAWQTTLAWKKLLTAVNVNTNNTNDNDSDSHNGVGEHHYTASSDGSSSSQRAVKFGCPTDLEEGNDCYDTEQQKPQPDCCYSHYFDVNSDSNKHDNNDENSRDNYYSNNSTSALVTNDGDRPEFVSIPSPQPSSSVSVRLWYDYVVGTGAIDGNEMLKLISSTRSFTSTSSPKTRSTSSSPLLWETLVASPARRQGVDVGDVLNAHERVLLERELADEYWTRRRRRSEEEREQEQVRQEERGGEDQGGAGRRGRRSLNGNRDCVATSENSATATVTNGATPGLDAERHWGNINSMAVSPPSAIIARGSGGGCGLGRKNAGGGVIRTKVERDVVVPGFPAVVVEDSAIGTEVGRGEWGDVPYVGGMSAAATRGSGAAGGRKYRGMTVRPLDLKGVAVDAHEVCVRERERELRYYIFCLFVVVSGSRLLFLFSSVYVCLAAGCLAICVPYSMTRHT